MPMYLRTIDKSKPNLQPQLQLHLQLPSYRYQYGRMTKKLKAGFTTPIYTVYLKGIWNEIVGLKETLLYERT